MRNSCVTLHHATISFPQRRRKTKRQPGSGTSHWKTTITKQFCLSVCLFRSMLFLSVCRLCLTSSFHRELHSQIAGSEAGRNPFPVSISHPTFFSSVLMPFRSFFFNFHSLPNNNRVVIIIGMISVFDFLGLSYYTPPPLISPSPPLPANPIPLQLGEK